MPLDVIQGSTPPASPNPGDQWLNTANGRYYTWLIGPSGNGAWVISSALGVAGRAPPLAPTPMAAPIVVNPTPKITSADVPPSTPANNDLWFDTRTGFLFIWYFDGNTYQWVVTNPGRGSDVPPPATVVPTTIDSDPGIVLTPDPLLGIGSIGVDTAWFDARVASEIPANLPPSGVAGGDLAGSYPNPVVKASVALGGNPTATTQATSDSSQRLATTAFVKTNIAALPAPPTTLPPSGAAGGDLAGSYPNPTIKPGTNTQLLTTVGGVAAWAAPPSTAPSGAAGGALSGTYPNPGLAVPYPTTLPPSGAAGGGLTGTYPNPTLVGGPLSNYALTSSIPTTLPGPPTGAAGGALSGTYPNPGLATPYPTTLPPNGPAGGDLAGSYPNPTIKPGTNTQVLTTVGGVAAWAAASGGGAATAVGTTPPGSPTDGQLWYYSDAVNGGGALYIRYNDGNTTQWVPASPAATPGSLIQTVFTEIGTSTTGTTVIPLDNTIPQITEGNQYMTLAITPKSATSKLIINVIWYGANSAGITLTVALFQDATANALAAVSTTIQGAGAVVTIPLRHVMTSGTTSATTFRVRVGGDSAGTTTFNASLYGGVAASSIVIQEVA